MSVSVVVKPNSGSSQAFEIAQNPDGQWIYFDIYRDGQRTAQIELEVKDNTVQARIWPHLPSDVPLSILLDTGSVRVHRHSYPVIYTEDA